MTISEAYDARLQNALAAGLTMEQAKERIDILDIAEFTVDAMNGLDEQFCFYGIKQGYETVASTWGTEENQDTQLKLARLFAASPDMLKALLEIIAAGFDCMTDEQFAAIDLVEAALKKVKDSAE